MAKQKKQDMWKMIKQLEMNLDAFFGKNAPKLPKGIKEFIVWVAPYLTILGIIFTVPALLALLGIGALLAPAFILTGSLTLIGMLTIVVTIISLLLEIMAVPGLFAKKKLGWDRLFQVSLLGVITAFISGNWAGLILGTAINWYFLFQIRAYYK